MKRSKSGGFYQRAGKQSRELCLSNPSHQTGKTTVINEPASSHQIMSRHVETRTNCHKVVSLNWEKKNHKPGKTDQKVQVLFSKRGRMSTRMRMRRSLQPLEMTSAPPETRLTPTPHPPALQLPSRESNVVTL